MRSDTLDKAVELGRYILRTGATVRETARVFGMSKSAVHKAVREPLREAHPGLYAEVSQVLSFHRAVRHLRGGEATREKYRLLREKGALKGR